MTETEITLFKELIRETVRSVLKEEKMKMTEEVKKAFEKDFTTIKKLIATQIKEGRERPVNNTVRMVEERVEPGKVGQPLSESRQAALKKALNATARGMGMPAVIPEQITPQDAIKNIKQSNLGKTTKSILMQTAMDMTQEDKDALNENLQDIPPEVYPDEYSLPDNIEEEYQPKFSTGFPPQRSL